MSRRPRRGSSANEPFLRDGDLAAAADGEPGEDERPSRTARKNASEELQEIGADLVVLRDDLLRRLTLPENLREAIVEARRLGSFGAKRRQAQLIGKLMRQLDADTLEAVREALRVAHGESAKDTLLLHKAEHWRDSLVAEDERLEQWLEQFPGTDAQRLRSLIRQARKDARATPPGEPARRGRAFREIFALVRAQLRAAAEARSGHQ